MYGFAIDLPEWLPASTTIASKKDTSKVLYKLQAFLKGKTSETNSTSIPITIFRSIASRTQNNMSQIHRD